MTRVCLLWIWILVTEYVTCLPASHITCEEQTTQASVYRTTYIVKKRTPSFTGCQRYTDWQTELALPPGAPSSVMATLSGTNLTFQWRPPDDGSVQFLSGFLIEIYVDSPTYQLGPHACYSVQILEQMTSKDDHVNRNCPLPQDAIFTLHCNVTGANRGLLDVVYVTSSPWSTRDIKTTMLSMEQSTVNRSADASSNWRTCTGVCTSNVPVYDQTCSTKTQENQDSIKARERILTFVIVGGSVLCCLGIVTMVFVYRSRVVQKCPALSNFSTSKDSRSITKTKNTVTDHIQDSYEPKVDTSTLLQPDNNSDSDRKPPKSDYIQISLETLESKEQLAVKAPTHKELLSAEIDCKYHKEFLSASQYEMASPEMSSIPTHPSVEQSQQMTLPLEDNAKTKLSDNIPLITPKDSVTQKCNSAESSSRHSQIPQFFREFASEMNKE